MFACRALLDDIHVRLHVSGRRRNHLLVHEKGFVPGNQEVERGTGNDGADGGDVSDRRRHHLFVHEKGFVPVSQEVELDCMDPLASASLQVVSHGCRLLSYISSCEGRS